MPLNLEDAEKELLKHMKIVYSQNNNLKATIPIDGDSPNFVYEVRLTYDGKQLLVDKAVEREIATARQINDLTQNWIQIPQINRKIAELKKGLGV